MVHDDVPIVCMKFLQDQANPLPAQHNTIEALGGEEKVRVLDVDSSHSSKLSMPKRCAEILIEASSAVATSCRSAYG